MQPQYALSPVLDEVDVSAEAFFDRLAHVLVEMIIKDGQYDPQLGASCIKFAAVEGSLNFTDAVLRIIKIVIVQSKCTIHKNKDYENLMSFRGNDGKKVFAPYRDNIDAQLRVLANVRGKKNPTAESKKKLSQDIIAYAREDVQGWKKVQDSIRQSP
jgi:hypothetical protein